jgi:hypothetical protein
MWNIVENKPHVPISGLPAVIIRVLVVSLFSTLVILNRDLMGLESQTNLKTGRWLSLYDQAANPKR